MLRATTSSNVIDAAKSSCEKEDHRRHEQGISFSLHQEAHAHAIPIVRNYSSICLLEDGFRPIPKRCYSDLLPFSAAELDVSIQNSQLNTTAGLEWNKIEFEVTSTGMFDQKEPFDGIGVADTSKQGVGGSRLMARKEQSVVFKNEKEAHGRISKISGAA